MVANVKRKRIITGETPVEELQRKFREEVTTMMKKAAIELGCNVEELKYRVSNVGIVEIERMDAQEMIDMAALEAEQKNVIAVKKQRGVL
jgi:hypothetical protein